MNHERLKELLEFHENHLKNVILPFWEREAIDHEYGGFYTCFNNEGTKLVSTDKYTWSQGRMVWLLTRLSGMDCFDETVREKYLEWARKGARFLMEHCLLENGNCTFLMDREGRPKPIKPGSELDISVSADRFAAQGICCYAAKAQDREAYEFAKKLYKSIKARLESGSYKSHPYPVPRGYVMHGRFMGLLDLSSEMELAARSFGDSYQRELLGVADVNACHIMDGFVDDDLVLHEMKTADGKFEDSTLFGRYVNPGHTVEDMWFVIHHGLKTGNSRLIEKACRVAEKALDIGWDNEYGGILLFADMEGGRPRGDVSGYETEEMARKITNDWSNKLWWPHSEALYTLLLAYCLTDDGRYLELYEKVHEYTFRVFPNPDAKTGEWIQIRDRFGKPESKVVALPVKDPYHIARNLLLIIELLGTVTRGRDVSEIAAPK